MIRRVIAVVLLVICVAAAYQFIFSGDSVESRLVPTQPTSVIGSGSEAVGVTEDGSLLTWLPAPKEDLPHLPLSGPPPDGRLAGPVLQQARVLGAAPSTLRPYIESSFYGDHGVDVVLKAGVQLLFGDASQGAKKWRAAATVIADPAVVTLDYINLQAPERPNVGGSGHTLPTLP